MFSLLYYLCILPHPYHFVKRHFIKNIMIFPYNFTIFCEPVPFFLRFRSGL